MATTCWAATPGTTSARAARARTWPRRRIASGSRAHLRSRALQALLLTATALAFAGCGGGGGDPSTNTPSAATATATATGGQPSPAHGSTIVAALGDSITSGSPGYDPDPRARQAYGFGDNRRSSYEFWAHRSHPGLVFRNCGVFGQRTDEIAARLQGCAKGADALIVQGGINDIAQSLQGGRPASLEAARVAAGNIAGMLDDAKRMDIPVAVTDVLPWNNGHPAADAAIDDLNSRITELAGQRRVPVLDFHDALADHGDPEVMSPSLTADGDHPSIAGYRLLGERAFRLP